MSSGTFVLVITLLLGGWTAALIAGILLYRSRGKQKELKTLQEVGVPIDWGILATGASGDTRLEVAWLRTAQQMYNIFCKKHHDYGPRNIGVGGVPGVVIRIGDKTSRLWNLTGVTKHNTRLVADESVRDSFLDLANYGISGAMLVEGSWPKYKPEEVWSVARNN